MAALICHQTIIPDDSSQGTLPAKCKTTAAARTKQKKKRKGDGERERMHTIANISDNHTLHIQPVLIINVYIM